MKGYEYKTVKLKEISIRHGMELDVAKLNEIGAEGWELVMMHSGEAIFKREKRVRQVRPL